MPGTTQDSRGYRAVVLGMLLLVYTFNFLDRQIVNILAEPIKNDLKLADWQLEHNRDGDVPGLMRRVAELVSKPA